MPAQQVRAAITAWLKGTAGIANVYKSQPLQLDPSMFVTASGVLGPVAFVHIEHQSETRLTPPSGSGLKQVDYDIGVVLIVRWMIPADAGDETGWVDFNDQCLDNLRARIRQDYMLGTNGNPIWQAGENVGDIQTSSDLPKNDGVLVESWNVVQFRAVEMIQPA